MKVYCSHTKIVPLDDLHPHPRNPNTHSDEQLKLLAKIMSKNGIRNPIKVSKRSGFITAGHGRLEAAKLNNWKEFPVDYQDYESEALEYADIVADNKIAELATLNLSMVNEDIIDLGPDLDLDLLGMPHFKVEPLDNLEIEGEEDSIPELNEKDPPITKPGDLIILGEHRLLCGDSSKDEDIQKLIQDDKVDMVFTDPPYGIGIDGQKESKAKNPKHSRKKHEFKGWDSSRPSEEIFLKIVSLDVPSAIFGGNYFADLLPASRGWIYWSKEQDGLSMSDGELVWTNQDKVLRCVRQNRNALKGSVHPTQKPISVVKFCLDFLGDGKAVLDLFGGSGSTLIACEKTSRKCLMMEIDPQYCDIIVKRWEDFTGKKAQRL